MAKPVLGRDLGALMGRKPKGSAAPAPSAPVLGAGVGSLLRGQRPAARPAAFPRWYLFAADLLLVALALITIYKSPRPVSWKTELFCGATVLLAAVLAVLALLMPQSQAPESPPPFK